ncbi:ferritin-like domain-containing protein [Marivirga sp.]|uniref:ferritin-like domain-containing protein n=1 Tax=Marivirga sp. TaxID=2018662 RepID=UPI002D7ED172|nr:ferritin-like domain-containing protein [Marivirga sp.]HET8859522.1 ferritin-like domain-containing protein [Marivirga sp.]
MSKIMKNKSGIWSPEEMNNQSRRKFLAYSGATIAISGLFLAGCNNDDEDNMRTVLNVDSPTNLSANRNSSGGIDLSWMDNSDNEDGFKIERANSLTDTFTEIASVTEGVTSYTDSMDIDSTTTYAYRVRGFKGTVYSAYSNVIDVDGEEPEIANLGTGDIAVLNYAYVLEQLEADFYTKVYAAFDDGSLSAGGETETILTDLYKHEVIHREFLRAALADNAVPDLTFQYTEGLFTSLDSVLATAMALEDTGVRAYNGAGQFFSNTDAGRQYLTLAGKIVSVEARHASAIRDLLNPTSADFAGNDIINSKGLEVTANPVDILPVAASFIVNEIDASGFPSGGMVDTQIAMP